MDKFVVGGKNDEKLIRKMIKELEGEEPVKERTSKPNTAFLNRLLSNTKRHNEKSSEKKPDIKKETVRNIDRVEKPKSRKKVSSSSNKPSTKGKSTSKKRE